MRGENIEFFLSPLISRVLQVCLIASWKGLWRDKSKEGLYPKTYQLLEIPGTNPSNLSDPINGEICLTMRLMTILKTNQKQQKWAQREKYGKS